MNEKRAKHIVDIIGEGTASADNSDGTQGRRRQLHGESEQRRRSSQVLRNADRQAGFRQTCDEDEIDRVLSLRSD